MELFSESDREAALIRTLEILSGDARIEAVVLTGSVGSGSMDRWSDLDLDAVVAEGESTEQVASDWVARVYHEWPIAHHYETSFDTFLVRGFLLDDGLVIDLAFDPVGDFSVWAPVRVAFDRTGRVTRIGAAPEAWKPMPDWRREAGFGWHDVLHACTAVARRRPWQAVYFLQRIRNRTLALASERHGWDSQDFKRVDELPAEERDPLLATLVDDLAPAAVLAAIDVATRGFLEELRRGDPSLADRLRQPLMAYIDATSGVVRPPGRRDRG